MVIKTSNYLRKEKKFRKKNYPAAAIETVIKRLVHNDREALRRQHRDHKLRVGGREVHVVRPSDNWLIRYQRNGNQIELLDMLTHDGLQ